MRNTLFSGIPVGARPARAGFSLMEVSLALVVAAGGLLAIFGIFPVSLRQSKMAERDTAENAFATTLLETMAGNVRMIDDIKTWNDPTTFLKTALAGTGVWEKSKFVTGGTMGKHHRDTLSEAGTESGVSSSSLDDFSPDSVGVGKDYSTAGEGEYIWYLGREKFYDKSYRREMSSTSMDKIVLPPQFLIRLVAIRREAGFSENEKTVWKPNVYLVSVVSTDGGFPEPYVREPLYSQEFLFVHRP